MISDDASSAWAERGFCKGCGTHLSYQMKGTGMRNVPLGILDDVDDFKFVVQIFVDRKPAAFSFAAATEMMTEAEVFAKYAPPEE